MATLVGHKRGIWSLKYSEEGLLASSSGDMTVKIWKDAQCIRTLEGHANSVLDVAFLPGGHTVVSAGGDGLLKVWNLKTGVCSTTLTDHEDKIWSVDTLSTEDGALILSGGSDGRLIVWKDNTT